MATNKKRKKKHPQGAPKPKSAVPAAAENVQEQREEKKQYAQSPRDSKPLYMRIIMLAIAAVMVLGIVIGAAAGSAGMF
ncbi:MAG: hypothetical protein J6M17_00445 [Ruminococcus sp.]|nr:hypothetical protein [Ruminococcus sp.]